MREWRAHQFVSSATIRRSDPMLLFTLPHALDWSLLALRLGIAAPFLVHGIEKKSYWAKRAGGQGNTRNMIRLFRFLSLVEPLGGLAVLIGFLTPIAAIGLAIIMLGAIRTKIVLWDKKFGDDAGWEIDWLILLPLIALILLGAGRYSVDALL
jgi:putative oxidoreductase